jgi:hypothetical protein
MREPLLNVALSLSRNSYVRAVLFLRILSEWLSRTQYRRGPDSSVGIATGYGLGGPGIESRWGARFSAPVQAGPGAHPASCTMGNGSFPGGIERPERDADPSPSIVVGHERVEQYFYSRCGPYGLCRVSVPVQGCTLPFTQYRQRVCFKPGTDQRRHFASGVCAVSMEVFIHERLYQ